jgi:hypothetical protein
LGLLYFGKMQRYVCLFLLGVSQSRTYDSLGIKNLLTFRTGVTFFCVADFLPGFAIKVDDDCYSVPEECFESTSG